MMDLKWIALLGLLALVTPVRADEGTILKDHKGKVSYSLGIDIGNTLKNMPVPLDPDLILKGIKDVLSASKPLMTEEEIRETIKGLQTEVTARRQEQMNAISKKNQLEGEAFLAENKKRDQVITLPSGLEYKVLRAGNGRQPKDDDIVTINYRGALINGTEFDSSYHRGQPVNLPVKAVIPGWREALKLMQEGEKWQIFIPPKLAYGERGLGSQIGPNATLIFELELLSIKDKKKN